MLGFKYVLFHVAAHVGLPLAHAAFVNLMHGKLGLFRIHCTALQTCHYLEIILIAPAFACCSSCISSAYQVTLCPCFQYNAAVNFPNNFFACVFIAYLVEAARLQFISYSFGNDKALLFTQYLGPRLCRYRSRMGYTHRCKPLRFLRCLAPCDTI